MGTRTMKRAGGATAGKGKATPKFLLVQDTGPANEPEATEAAVEVETIPEEDWPEREDIRKGLVDQVSARFGISPDAAMRAVDDMLRLS